MKSEMLSLIAYLLLPLINSLQHSLSPNILADPTYKGLLHELETYQFQHNRSAILSDHSFCQRRFSLATYACPQAMGNHMHEFLNTYVAAFVTNRTLVWNFCDRKPCKVDVESDCALVLNRFDWMFSFNEFKNEWQSRNCTGSMDPFHLIKVNDKWHAEEISMCCGFDILDNFPILHYGTFELHEFMGLSAKNAKLNATSKYRAKLLFEHGEDFAYGVLFRTAFAFRENIINDTLKLLSKSIDPRHENPFLVSVHLRHSSNDGDLYSKHLLDKEGMRCVAQMLETHKNISEGRPCYVLLGSDRNQTINFWRENVQSQLNCSLIYTDHGSSHPEWTEHGPFTGDIAAHDIDLLSHGDIFIGSTYHENSMRNLVSTFSLLIAERRASSGKPYAQSIRSRWLADRYYKQMNSDGQKVFMTAEAPCREVIGARHDPKPMYQSDSFVCDKELMPIECPFHDSSMMCGPDKKIPCSIYSP